MAVLFFYILPWHGKKLAAYLYIYTNNGYTHLISLSNHCENTSQRKQWSRPSSWSSPMAFRGAWCVGFFYFPWKRNFLFFLLCMDLVLGWIENVGKERTVLGFFPIFLGPQLASYRLNLNWVCGSSFVMRDSVYRSMCLSDEKGEENDRKRNRISPSYN
jgi:hypothetical protein